MLNEDEVKKLHYFQQRKEQLEKAIQKLQLKKHELENRLPDAECERKFRLWGGYDLQESTETNLNVTFIPFYQGRVGGSYSVSLCKSGPGAVWTPSHYNLPYSIQHFSERVKNENLSSVHRLTDFIRCLRHEINLFVWRREQFKEAMSLVSPSLKIHPSVSSTEVMITCAVNDSLKSDLCKAFIRLRYRRHQYLPHFVDFDFTGGMKKDQTEFQNQLATMKIMPLKEALMAAFSMHPTSNCTSMEPNIYTVPEPCAPAEEYSHPNSTMDNIGTRGGRGWRIRGRGRRRASWRGNQRGSGR